MKQSRVLIYCLIMCILTGVSVYYLILRQTKKIGVVDAIQLFDQYNMKKELESQAKVKLQKEGAVLDSVENKLKMAQATRNDSDVRSLTRAYSILKVGLQNDFKQSNQDINTEIWKRLNPLVEEYGKSKHLHLIIGANGMGSVLYNDDYFDMTADMIKFVNKKYEGGN